MGVTKTLRISVFSLLAAVALTMVLGVTAVRACSDLVIGAGWSCELTGQDPSYCYYTCECHGISQAECERRLGEAGFEPIIN